MTNEHLKLIEGIILEMAEQQMKYESSPEMMELKERMEALKKEYEAEAQKVFDKLLARIWDDPRAEHIHYITWTQYTPYFNDGDECVFGIGDIQFSLTDEVVDNPYDLERVYELSEWMKISSYLNEYIKNVEESLEIAPLEVWQASASFTSDFSKVLRQLEDQCKVAYGDHVVVRLWKDGRVDIDDYDHD